MTDALSESPDSYTTPLLVQHDGKTEIVITGGDVVTSHDPATGAELWRADVLNPTNNRNYRIVASPVMADGLIIAPSRNNPLVAHPARRQGRHQHVARRLVLPARARRPDAGERRHASRTSSSKRASCTVSI